jgi:O-acetyl-ADP-ribose deacetylase (regulator of RNase III)
MTITYLEGDLFEAGSGVIAHGCNAKGKFGKGFALALAKRFPAAKAAYERVHLSGGLVLGSVVWAECDGILIANCITQATYGNDGKRHVSYSAVASCMRMLNNAADWGVPGTSFESGFDKVHMPLIGADLGGGDWSEISSIVERELTVAAPIVHILPDAKPEYKRLVDGIPREAASK